MTVPTDDQRQEWNDLARLDPFWAVLSHPDKKFGRWDPTEFLSSGTTQIDALLATAAGYGVPSRFATALDFGCGLGRLAPGLCARFDSYQGVDISEEMVKRAVRLHGDRADCTFTVDDGGGLEAFPDDHFDAVVSLYVLQHVRDKGVILDQLRALVRVLRPGGMLAVQLPASVPAPVRLRHLLRRRLYNRLRAAGVAEDVLYRRLRLSPITMTPVAEAEVTQHLGRCGARLLTVERDTMGRRTPNRLYVATKDDTR